MVALCFSYPQTIFTSNNQNIQMILLEESWVALFEIVNFVSKIVIIVYETVSSACCGVEIE